MRPPFLMLNTQGSRWAILAPEQNPWVPLGDDVLANPLHRCEIIFFPPKLNSETQSGIPANRFCFVRIFSRHGMNSNLSIFFLLRTLIEFSVTPTDKTLGSFNSIDAKTGPPLDEKRQPLKMPSEPKMVNFFRVPICASSPHASFYRGVFNFFFASAMMHSAFLG